MSNQSFELIKEADVTELNIHVKWYRHTKTGAQLLSVINDDENKSFGITFRTPPTDSTGLPHIMEHSVLCGSRKYPLKEPFVELAKGSLNTFLNAFTYPDRTCYPVASQNLQDFYNLIDVYLDAVFYPRITPDILQQEGWHYELQDKNDPLIYKGVVFNEMKGAYSSPEGMMGRYIRQALYPDTPYGVDSGGDPTVMPDLTYEQFKAFHDRLYHPSNAYIYFYGDDAPDKRLAIMEEYLKDFHQLDPQSTITLQQPFNEPKQISYPYAASPQDAELGKSLLTLNWLLPENNNPELGLALSVLSHALLHTPASPLRKALLDSGLGEDVLGGGFVGYLRQMSFSVGLKGFPRDKADQVQRFILDALAEIVDTGLDSAMVEASMNTIEFRLREYNTGGFPKGLAIMVNALALWINDGDPIDYIAFEGPLATLKENLANDSRYFEGLIQQYLLDNAHRVTVMLEPDVALQQHQETEEAAKLAAIKANMTDAELEQVIKNTQTLIEAQGTPDPPDVLATVPTLHLDDIDKKNKSIPREAIQENGYTTLYHDLFTSNIVYLEVGFNLHGLPEELLPYIGLFSDALLEIGTAKEDYVKLSQRIGQKTGGLRAYPMISAQHHSAECAAWLFVRGKSMVNQFSTMLDIIKEVLLTVKFDNQERFKQMVLEEKAQQEASLVPSGHRFVGSRLQANFSETGWVGEQTGGINYLFFLRQLIKEVENNWPEVLAKLERIRTIVINRNAAICNVTLDHSNWQTLQPILNRFMADLPAQSYTPVTWTQKADFGNEGLAAPGSQVNYVGKASNIYKLGYQFHGSISVISNYIRTSYLWERVRVQGGAYGAFCSFDRNTGVYNFLSYRDPNLLKTLTNYNQIADYLKQIDLNEDQLTKSIIGVIGSLDTYRLPDAKGYTSLIRHLLNYSDEMHQQYREQILTTTAQHFKDFAEILAETNHNNIVGMLGSPDALKAANEAQGGDWLTIIDVK